ncbi:MAG: methyltransferase domain-containing protein [Pseudomonadota bacterium]
MAQIYRDGIAAEKAGDIAAAAAAFREALRLNPSDPGNWAVRLAALGVAADPRHASPAYVRTLFDQIASDFDDRLVRRLGYGVPGELATALMRIAPDGFARGVDLGCGTGLVGQALNGFARMLHGVDLSEGMLQRAWERRVYQNLFVGDATRYLELAERNAYNLATAADVFPYVGTPERLLAAAAHALAPGGLFAFSTETMDTEAFEGRAWRVNRARRFAHELGGLTTALQAAGFEPLSVECLIVRREAGQPVLGHLVVAQLLA